MEVCKQQAARTEFHCLTAKHWVRTVDRDGCGCQAAAARRRRRRAGGGAEIVTEIHL
jgi:hypothetical protein